MTVVVNRTTKGDADRIVRELTDSAPSSMQLSIVYTSPQRLSADQLLGSGDTPEVVVAVGGDGTVAEVATALAGSKIPIAIVPAGSTNVIAQGLGIPRDSGSAIRIALSSGRVATIDAGESQGRWFLHMAGVGLDSQMFMATQPELKRRVGWPAYVPAAVTAARMRATRVRLTVDNAQVEVDSRLILVANGNFIIHPALSFFSDIRPDDGLFDVLAFTSTRASELARTAARFASRSLSKSPYLLRLRGRTVTIEAEKPQPVELDGDVVGMTPVTLIIRPNSASFIVP